MMSLYFKFPFLKGRFKSYFVSLPRVIHPPFPFLKGRFKSRRKSPLWSALFHVSIPQRKIQISASLRVSNVASTAFPFLKGRFKSYMSDPYPVPIYGVSIPQRKIQIEAVKGKTINLPSFPFLKGRFKSIMSH